MRKDFASQSEAADWLAAESDRDYQKVCALVLQDGGTNCRLSQAGLNLGFVNSGWIDLPRIPGVESDSWNLAGDGDLLDNLPGDGLGCVEEK
jgi:hypothetical protein